MCSVCKIRTHYKYYIYVMSKSKLVCVRGEVVKRITMICAAAVVLVAVVVLNFLVMRSSGAITSLDGQQVSPALMSQLYSIANNQTLADEIGVGAVASSLPLNVNGSALVADGKPVIMYVGGDACPYCAITRWGLVIALMRFGNFTHLHYTTSNASDIYPNSATFSFYNSSYSSKFLNFTSVEIMTSTEKPLQTPNSWENATFDKYDLNNAALPSEVRGSIPFIDFANKSIEVGSLVSPQALNKRNWAEITAAMHNSSSQTAQEIIGSANVYTAYICASNASIRQSAVCNQSYIAKVKLLGGHA